ncbi:mRNA turnover protein 4 [Planoprotostelium fungivorum]|uniref:Ribosome assembly factor mrt4 n=1 Tax=Planoprotostelium fungivorum TaxID=1890364 RepID=A0A2P6NR96_9EUKA|nr:mRNA turnover protein 4 [Planoprotostelium fungivorum]
MPKSKKNKVVHTSKTESKGKEKKKELVEDIQKQLEKFEFAYIITPHNMRNTSIKDVRTQFPDSRFFFGKNRIMQRALGTSAEDEYKEGLHKLSEHLTGDSGLFLTNDKDTKVLQFFKDFKQKDYARAGFIATETVVIPEGPLKFEHPMEPMLREQLRMPTALKQGVIHLLADFEVCTEGNELTPEQGRILKLFEKKMSEFYIDVECVWRKTDGKFKKLSS